MIPPMLLVLATVTALSAGSLRRWVCHACSLACNCMVAQYLGYAGQEVWPRDLWF